MPPKKTKAAAVAAASSHSSNVPPPSDRFTADAPVDEAPAPRIFKKCPGGDATSPCMSFSDAVHKLLRVGGVPSNRPDLEVLEKQMAELDDDDIDSFVYAAQSGVDASGFKNRAKHLTHLLRRDEMLAIASYTLEFPLPLYKLLNAWLMNRDRSVKEAIGPFFCLLYRGLEKLPLLTRTANRGVQVHGVPALADTWGDYRERCRPGSDLNFWAFASFSLRDDVATNSLFVGRDGEPGIVYSCGELQCVDIAPLSLNPVHEAEVLPMPPLLLKVQTTLMMPNKKLVISVAQQPNERACYVVPRRGVVSSPASSVALAQPAADALKLNIQELPRTGESAVATAAEQQQIEQHQEAEKQAKISAAAEEAERVRQRERENERREKLLQEQLRREREVEEREQIEDDEASERAKLSAAEKQGSRDLFGGVQKQLHDRIAEELRLRLEEEARLLDAQEEQRARERRERAKREQHIAELRRKLLDQHKRTRNEQQQDEERERAAMLQVMKSGRAAIQAAERQLLADMKHLPVVESCARARLLDQEGDVVAALLQDRKSEGDAILAKERQLLADIKDLASVLARGHAELMFEEENGRAAIRDMMHYEEEKFCFFCNEPVGGWCLNCMASGELDAECYVAWGQCNHAFHNCCLKSCSVCPTCSQPWIAIEYTSTYNF